MVYSANVHSSHLESALSVYSEGNSCLMEAVFGNSNSPEAYIKMFDGKRVMWFLNGFHNEVAHQNRSTSSLKIPL